MCQQHYQAHGIAYLPWANAHVPRQAYPAVHLTDVMIEENVRNWHYGLRAEAPASTAASASPTSAFAWKLMWSSMKVAIK